jgi:hypothetical protein
MDNEGLAGAFNGMKASCRFASHQSRFFLHDLLNAILVGFSLLLGCRYL